MDVNWRLFTAAAAAFLFTGINGYLLAGEDLLLLEEEKKHDVISQDPLRDLQYIKANRKLNFEKMGFPPKEVEKALRTTQDYEDSYAERVKALLKSADDPDALADALCGETTDISPRYGALRFFVTEEKGRRQAVNLRMTSGFEEQEWALAAPIAGVFTETELVDARQPDASLMAIAGILLAKEKEIIEHNKPWGGGLVPGAWSWELVKKENPGIDELAIDYFATQHLVTELAQAEGGICDA